MKLNHSNYTHNIGIAQGPNNQFRLESSYMDIFTGYKNFTSKTTYFTINTHRRIFQYEHMVFSQGSDVNANNTGGAGGNMV